MTTDNGKITITMQDLLSCASLGSLAKVTRRLDEYVKNRLPAGKFILEGNVRTVVSDILRRLRGFGPPVGRSQEFRWYDRLLDKLNVTDDLTRCFSDFCESGHGSRERERFEKRLFDGSDKSMIEFATQCKQYYLHLSDRLEQARARVRKEIIFDDLPGSWLSEPMRDLVLSNAVQANESPSLWYSDIESCALSATNSFPRDVYTFVSVRMTSVATAHVAVAVVKKRFPVYEWRNRGTERIIDTSYDNYIAPTPKMDQLAAACSPSGSGLYFTTTILVVISIIPTWESHHEQAIESSGSRSGGHKISQPQVKVTFKALPQRDDVPFIVRVYQAIKDAGKFPDLYVNMTPISIEQALKAWEIA